ncbi:carbohydrate ABC transporter permease [Limnochorda pilosa]|uniref:carbohydrate ABC transporter permease n=1 Tax=Limnochorda pilosa TaxID=1555112 RepID=UPI0026F33C98|nr:carbohydrate ABC transporter permease [Limnochorda pilosa]
MSHLFTGLAMILVGIWLILPFYWAIITSLKRPADVFKLSVIPFLQFDPTLANWRNELVLRRTEILSGLSTSFIVAVSTAVIALAIGTLAGYALARFKYQRWKNKDIALWILSQRFLPPAATVIPFFLMFKQFGLLDTRLALILVNTTFTIPFAVLILRDAFRELPIELEEAAQVDGCSPFQSFTRIALPLVAPALVSAGIIMFAFTWNEFLFAFILTYSKATPITVIISGTSDTTGVQFWYVSTRMLMAILPPALLTLTVQRYIVRGLTFGAVKG